MTRFETFGCRLNAWESEAMGGLAREAEVGDAVVVNTCAVTAEAVRQARQRIRRLRRDHPAARIVVTGCAAQTEPGTFAEMPEVDHVVGNAEKLDPDAWRALAGGTAAPVAVSDIQALQRPAAPLIDGFGTWARAHVQVQNGCDHRCTFCVIPYGRGPSRSVPAETVVEQVRRLAARGYREVVLTGVDLTSWGGDLDGRPPLGALVQRVLEAVPELQRLRISSIDQVKADPGLLDAIGDAPRLMPHLHLSLQAGADLILKRMKRRHLRDDAIRFCEEVRRRRPEITFGADLIAGFPTETEAEFAETLDLVEACGLTWLHVFPYSARAGTPAARMPQVPVPERRARAARLRALGEARVAAHLDRWRGREAEVLMETPRRGRTESFAEVEFAADGTPGTIVTARIAGHDGRRLRAGR